MAERAGVTALMRSVRDRHLAMILRQLLEQPLARKELARRTGISFTTITRLVGALLAAGVIEELPVRRTNGGPGGRPEVPLGFPDAGRIVIGTHIRAHATTVTAYTLTGRDVATAEAPHPGTRPEHVIASGISITDQLIGQVGRDRVAGVGVSTGGVVDFESGSVISSPQLGWHRVPLSAPFEQALRLPVVVDNSVRALAISRLQWPGMAESSVLVVFVAGVVSAALIVDRHVHRGPGATAGDVGHLPVADTAAQRCPCGSSHCLGMVVTDEAVLRQAISTGLLPADASWDELYRRPRDTRIAIGALMRRRARTLGDAVGHMIEMLNPELTIVAGRIGSPGEIRDCLAAAERRCQQALGGPRPIHHWPVAESEWDRASAALLLDDYVRRPTRYEPALL